MGMGRLKRILPSLARIGGTVTLVVLVFVWVLRQPNLGTVPFAGALHAAPVNLEAHVRFLASPGYSRCADNTAGLDRAAAHIAEAFGRTGARFSTQTYRAGGTQARNLIAAFGPEVGPHIVVGAHYDVFSDYPGADDNASGVAGILELARLLDHQKLAVPVEIVAYSTEEPPYFGGPEMGSAVHARSLAAARVAVRAMISLEMIGYFSATQPNQNPLLHLLYPRDGEFIALVGRWADRDLVRQAKQCFRGATSVRAVSYSGPVGLGSDLSDQRNYWALGYPGLMVTDTAFMRNLHYHGADDTADTLDYQRMAGVVDGVFNTVLHLADAP
jgi:Zn-dependent M28 family amino/carboxypeptidase